jgi:hypothetical protein
MTTIPSFNIKTAQYNTSNLQNLGASLSQFIINPTNLTTSLILIPSQLNNLFTNPIVILTGPASNEYIIINYIITELLFTTGATQYTEVGGPTSFYSYNTDIFTPIPPGISIARAIIIDNKKSLSFNRGSGVSADIQDILGQPIYMLSSDSGTFNSGTSNVKLIINYGLYTYP